MGDQDVDMMESYHIESGFVFTFWFYLKIHLKIKIIYTYIQGRTGSKKQPLIFSQIGPPQLQTAATISQYYSNQCIAFMANNITKPMVTLLKKTQ